jgi:hypothetical protein
MKHRIQKQELLIDIGPRSEAFRLQHTAAQYARNTLLPALENIFNELSGEDEVIYIDRIFIDLGFLDEASLQGGILTPALYQRIREELRRVILGERPDTPATRTSVRENVLTQWWYYMEHGRLAWNGDRPDARWYAKVLEMFSVDYPAISKLRTALQNKPWLRARISAQHDTAFLENLVTVLTSTRHEELGVAVAELTRTLRFIEQLAGGRILGTTTIEKNQKRHATKEMIRKWTQRLAVFLALPETQREEFIWNSLLKDAAARPAEWAQKGGVAILLDWIWDRPPLMRLLVEAFTGRDNLFIRQFRIRHKATRSKSGSEKSPDASNPDPPTTPKITGETGDTATPAPSTLMTANSPQVDLPRQSTPSTPADAKEVERAIEEACRIIQFLAGKYRELVAGTDQQHGAQTDTELKFLFIQWADRMEDILAVPASVRRDYVRRWLGEVASSRSAKWAQKDAIAILLDRVWDSLPLMELILGEEFAAGNASPFLQLIHRRYQQQKKQPIRARPDDHRNVGGDLPATASSETGKKQQPAEPSSPSVRQDTDGANEGSVMDDQPPVEQFKSVRPAAQQKDAGEGEPVRDNVLKEEEFLFRSEEVAEEGIYIPHAGIILVHPFITTFFSRRQLWDKTGFVDLYARQQAIYLLHYLATGERTAPEYELVMPKMLCGYALDMPLPGDILLEDEACGEGDLLLQNVLQRWEKLKNTSVDGLREGFLRRNGKLFNRDGRLCLQVESSSIDVLLDFLPWNLSLVKLPWLKEILYVEWR